MIQINQLTLRRGTKTLLSDSHLTVYPQERVGIIGANGAGKTSLFA
ncbi:MAG TPA: ATP-binding cassette domain-containing protein, partial [Paenalcaligenes sp.]|nr:ATP-binding cassette domain-containing protein [Paenalcaligenes sp.]